MTSETSTSDAPVETGLIIDGAWRAATGDRTYELHNPARPGELVGRGAAGSAADADAAVRAAHRAFPGWAALSYEDRAHHLLRIADHLADDVDDTEARIRLLTREHGKVLKESRLEITRLGDRFRLCAAYAERLARDEHLEGPPFDTVITRQARGVAALITPWNWPLSILGAKLPQALIAGNTVVIKPARSASLAPVQTIMRIAEALPPGVVNVVTGSGGEVGDALLAHPAVRQINFTGGVETGKHVMAMAATTLKAVTLELGGNDAAVVLDDADLGAEALQRMVMGTFLTAGQVCMAIKRLYVHRSRYDELVEGFGAAVDRSVVGDGLDPRATMGPLNNAAQLEVVRGLVGEARAHGATVRACGEVLDPAAFEAGYFHRPTVITDLSPALGVVTSEQFGPVIPILPFDDDDEAVRLANDSAFGLCSSVWSESRERAVALARRLEAGTTYLNAHGPAAQDSRAPFGGMKDSGIGRNLGYEGVVAFTEPHSISSAPGWLLG